MRFVYFYKGYIKPNTDKSLYIFQYKENKDKFCIIECGNILTEKYVDVYNTDIKHPFIKNKISFPNYIPINTLRIATCFGNLRDSEHTPLFVEIVNDGNNNYIQLYTKKFKGNYRKINPEKFHNLEYYTYTFFSTGKIEYQD